ncbi:MAG: cation:proton antiporter [Rhodovibrionaceae bacterium]|nr:cation:proton antiporter [Rhodovibrionaceae bacterium]
MEQIFAMLLVLLTARLLGHGAVNLGQPSSLGEIAAGIVLGVLATLFAVDLPWLAMPRDSEAIAIVAQGGIFMLLLAAGVEMDIKEIREHSREAFLVALGGMLVPLAAGYLLAVSVLPEGPGRHIQALVVGVALAISAIPVAAKVFMDFGLLHHRVGETVIAAAVIDDVLGLVLLAIVTSLIAAGGVVDAAQLGLLLAQIVVFFAVTAAIGHWLCPHMWAWAHRQKAVALPLTLLIALALGFGVLAELLSMHFVLGPFMAGLFFDRARVGEQLYEHVRHVVDMVTFGFLAPVFFASIGLQLDLEAVVATPIFLAALIVIAFLGKVFGAGLPAYWSGFTRRESLAVGVGMSGRGAVEIVVAGIALQAGVFATQKGEAILDNMFSALVITAVATTMLTPVLLRPICRRLPGFHTPRGYTD